MTFRNVTHLGFVSFGFSARRRRRHNAIEFSLWRLTKNETYTVETTRPPGVRRRFSSRLCFCFFFFHLNFLSVLPWHARNVRARASPRRPVCYGCTSWTYVIRELFISSGVEGGDSSRLDGPNATVNRRFEIPLTGAVDRNAENGLPLDDRMPRSCSDFFEIHFSKTYTRVCMSAVRLTM